jgi:hypothetical protein
MSFGDAGSPGASGAGRELIVSEAEAAKMLKIGRRGLELLEVIDDQPPPERRLPG